MDLYSNDRIVETIYGDFIMIRLKQFFVFFIMALLWSCGQQRLDYPIAKKVDVVDDYHGTKVADPYRWLENADAEDTRAWVEAENKITYEFIRTSPGYEKTKQRLTQLWDYAKYSAPFKKGDRYFFSKNNGLQNQSVLYMQTSLDAEPVVLLDPNTFSKDGTVALSGMSMNEDGTLLAYGISKSGSDQREYHIRNTDSGEDFNDVILWCKFAGIAWKHDNSGFFYNRFPKPGTVAREDENKYNRVYWHKLGTPQSQDIPVFKDDANKELGFWPFITEDGKYLVLHVYSGTDPRNMIYYRKVNSKRPFKKLIDKLEAEYSFIYNKGPLFYFKTNLDAPKGRIIAIDIRRPDRKNWKEIIPENKDVLDIVSVNDNKLVTAYMHDVHHLLKIFDFQGNPAGEIKLPAIGTVGGLSGKSDESEMFITFTSFLYPTTIFRYDFRDGKMEVFRQPKIDFNPDEYVTRQVFCRSKDGTRVPIFITHKKDIKLNGDNPTLLYAYGGFNVSIKPHFSVSRLFWMENGGIYAVAILRGGSEYGEEWHRAGMLGKKQNVFDDFIAAGEWLIENKYTSNKKLAINGGSNGGLLTAACLLQRPDLYGAVVSQVPVIDMLRYHKFTVGHFWIPEYGNAEANEEDFKFLYAYSPLHNVKENVDYPPTLVTTADTDDRVAPLHAKKFVATLQEKYKGSNPILLRVETKAGHGAGKPTTKRIEEAADIYTFLFKVFGMDN